MKVNIHNQCSNFNLINSRYFDTGIDWNIQYAWEVDTISMINVDFK
jgi:hypothetical protein